MNWQWITEEIGYLPDTQCPLSANVGLVRTDAGVWLFDLGCTAKAAKAVNALTGEKYVVLSHFHPDHIGNLERVQYDVLYAGAFTCKKIGTGITVSKDLQLDNGLHLFPIPSGHAKGCIGMEYGGYAFLGDAIYPAQKADQAVYNVSLLAQQIQTLNALQAEWFLVSHKMPFVQSKAMVIAWLKQIYALRKPGQSYLCISKNRTSIMQ